MVYLLDVKEVPHTQTIRHSPTSVSNVKWGDIIWSGKGVVDQPGSSPDATIVLDEAETAINLENKTSSDGLIIIPIPIPLPPHDGSSVPPTPVEPNPPAPEQPGTPVPPADKEIPGKTTPTQAPEKGKGGLASTGANVAWLAGGAVLLLLIGAGLVLRGRKEES